MKDGQQVSWVGPEADGMKVGDQGLVMTADGSSAHVRWTTGARRNQIDLVDSYDLAAPTKMPVQAGLDDSLEVGTLVATSAREVYDSEGDVGLLNLMAEHGHLAAFQAIAENAMSRIQSEIRNDPSFRAVAAQLDEEESDSLVRLATQVLVRDAFGQG